MGKGICVLNIKNLGVYRMSNPLQTLTFWCFRLTNLYTMKNLSNSNELVINKLESFLKSNEEFKFNKVISEESNLVTYEIVKKFKSENRRLTIMKHNYPFIKEEYFFSTLKDFDELQDIINSPYNFKNGCKIHGQYLSPNRLIKWLNDGNNELLWFPENPSFKI
jgi:hypothetical protein